MNLLFCFLFFFQSKNITVIDFETNKPVPFVSFIGLKDNKGGYADENGVISFEGNMTQPFVISCTGYSPDTVSFDVKTIRLKPLSIVLPTIVVSSKKAKYKTIELGAFKKNSWVSFASQAKYEYYTFIANPDTSVKWQITSIKIAVRGYRKKKFEYFKIRPYLKEVLARKPNHDLLTKNVTVDVHKGQKSLTLELSEPIILPKEGCFVGFEPIGYSIKANEFIPYSDYTYNINSENVSISIPLVKSNTRSMWRVKNGKSWFGSPSDTYNAFGFGLEVMY